MIPVSFLSSSRVLLCGWSDGHHRRFRRVNHVVEGEGVVIVDWVGNYEISFVGFVEIITRKREAVALIRSLIPRRTSHRNCAPLRTIVEPWRFTTNDALVDVVYVQRWNLQWLRTQMTVVGREINRSFAFIERLCAKMFVIVGWFAVEIFRFKLREFLDFCFQIRFKLWKKRRWKCM